MCNNKAMGKLLNLWYVEAVKKGLARISCDSKNSMRSNMKNTQFALTLGRNH